MVDGINALSKKLPGGDKFRLSGPLYVGGAPLALLVRPLFYSDPHGSWDGHGLLCAVLP